MSMFYELMMKKKGMPSRYQEVEYIESDGTQYIDTGIKPTNATTIKLKTIAFNKNVFIYGCRPNYSANNKHTWTFSDVGSFYPQFGSDGNSVSYDWSTQAIYEIENGQNGAYVNGVKIKTYSETTFNSTLNMFLFGVNENGSLENRTLKGRIYYFQVYEGTTLIRNFIPVYDTLTNKYGMWETVQGKFYGNAGTGDFKGSIVGYTIVGSPTITDGVVSGFSDSDYVLLNENIPFATGDVFIEMKYSVTSLPGTTLLGTYGSSRMQLKYSNNKLEFYWGGNQIINFSGFNLADYQYIRVVSNYQGGTLEIYASVDGNNWSLITSASNVNWNYSQTYPTQFGRYPVSSDFTIDFNNTYIKKDGKLWFNGQQA